MDSFLRHQLCGGRGRHQPVPAGPHRVPHAAGASQLVGIGPQEGARVLHHAAAARERDDGRLRLDRSVPVLRVLGRHAHPDVLPDRGMGIRTADLRRGEVHPVHDGRQRPHAAGHTRPRVAAFHGDRQLQLRPGQALGSGGAARTSSSGSSSRSRSPSRSRCRCFPFIRGCPMRTSRPPRRDR